ncbi:MAG TPA: SMC-Scp complex subunit ScpB [Dehalococcoidia bacterium]
MTREALKQAIESILFVADGGVEIKTLARLTDSSEEAVTHALEELAEESASRGVRIQRTETAAQMASAPENTVFVQRFLGIDENARLSPSVLATLTVIAYKQPITKSAVERILDKSCDYGVHMLRLRGLITEVGRAPGAGRPYLYGTTFKFLEHFGLEKPEDLPALPELEAAETPEEADGEEPAGDEDTS